MPTIPIEDVPGAKEAKINWIIASGPATKAEAIELAKKFVKNVKDIQKSIV